MAVTTGIGGGTLSVGFTKEQADFLQCPAAGEVVQGLHQKSPKDDGMGKEALARVRLVGGWACAEEWRGQTFPKEALELSGGLLGEALTESGQSGTREMES